MAFQRHTNLLLAVLLSAGLLESCSAGSAVPDYGYDSSHSSSTGVLHAWDMDYNTLPRKAVIHKDTNNADKLAVLKVTVTLKEDHTSCPSTHSDMDGLRRYVAEAFDTMLRRAHIDAKIKIGTLGCQANIEQDCVKVELQFVVKLHSKKASDQLPRFVNVVTTAPYSHKPICEIQELDCHAHDVACIEVEQLSRKPHGTMLHKYVPADAEVDVDGEQDDSVFAGHSSWTRKSHHGKKHKHSKSDETTSETISGTDDVTGETDDATDGDKATSNGDNGSDDYGVQVMSARKAGGTTTDAAPAPELDTRIWPDETEIAAAAAAPTAPARVQSAFVRAASAIAAAARATSSAAAAANARAAAAAASSAADTAKAAAAHAAVAAAAANAAAEPQQLGPLPFDIRLWPLMPSIRAAAPLQ